MCFSGGHSSALVAIEVVRRYGNRDVVLLNHDIHARTEDADVKRFKREEDEKRPEIRPAIELPLGPPPPRRVRDESEDADRGVIVIDL